MNNTKLQSNWERAFRRIQFWLQRHHLGYGALTLLCILTGLSALVAFNFTPRLQIYLEGDLAGSDIVADRGFLIEDAAATRSRQEQLRTQQPLVCDLSPEVVDAIATRVADLFTALRTANHDEREDLRVAFAEETGEEIPTRLFQQLEQEDVQKLFLTEVMPWLSNRLLDGVISDSRLLLPHKGGALIRNPADGTEAHYADAQNVPDLKNLLADLSVQVRTMPGSALGKRAAVSLATALANPTLTPNYEATRLLTQDALRALGPVMIQVQKGEVIVRQGERVTKEQQLKLQNLRQRKSDAFNHTAFIGTLLISLIISSGMFFSPSGKPSTPIRQKDLVFIGTLVALMAVSSKFLGLLGQKLVEANPTFSAEALVYALPVAGIAGLSALIFSTRRFLVTGLLLAFFCASMNKGSLAIFMFYFLSAMWNTWLIVRTQTRHDVVASILPLLAGLYVMWAGATFMQGGPHTRYLAEAIAVFSGGIISMLLVFSLAPCVEMIFGYSTRFKLMELMNLDQPLLRELMLNAPGTYHHSLITSQLVEAGAKAIGAHSLLCKVAALYHDVGKVSRPDYFIENQFGGDNPHDRLAPSMSALIITSHVKKGVEIAQAHRLGHEVIDIIRQHHGTGTISYFYQKAVDLGENPRVADFSYAGPKPQSREAAIVMLADAVEASSRTLSNPTSSRLQTHINTIIKTVFATGQLDESELTFKDLDKLSESFLRVLAGLFHHRIKYPPTKDGKEAAKECAAPPLKEDKNGVQSAMQRLSSMRNSPKPAADTKDEAGPGKDGEKSPGLLQ